MSTMVFIGARRRSLALVAAAALFPVALTGLGATPAAAATVRFADATGDAAGAPDLTRVTVRNAVQSAPRRVTVVLGYVPDRNTAVSYNVFIDTDARRVGPEFRFDVIPNSEGFGLHRWVGGWAGHVGRQVTCARLRISADAFGGTPVRVSLPRGCLGNPGRVRVAAQSINEVNSPEWRAVAKPTDWAPRRHVFYGWVGRGGR